jgi:hypothetical protein
MSSFTCAADLEKVFNIPRILNLPFSTIPQTCVKTIEKFDPTHYDKFEH